MTPNANQKSSDRLLQYQLQKWYAIVLIIFGKQAFALRVYESMIKRFGIDSHTLAARAHLLAQFDRSKEALDDYVVLTQLDSEVAAHWFNRAFIEQKLGQYQEALQSFQESLKRDENLDRAWFGLALVYIELTRYEEAIEALKRNTQLQPMSPHGWYELAKVYYRKNDQAEVKKIISHLYGFEPKVARQLKQETSF